MQNSRPLVAPDSELLLLEPGLDEAAGTRRMVAFQLWALLAAGSTAGMLFGVSDIVRASATIGSSVNAPAGAAMVALWLWFGQLLAVGLWSLGLLAATVKRRVANPTAWHGVLAVGAALVVWALAHKLFAGRGLQRAHFGGPAQWVLSAAGGLGVWFVLRLVERRQLDASKRFARFGIAASVALSIAAAALEAYTVGGYLYVHVLLLTLSMVLATHALERARLPSLVGQTALAASLLMLPSLVAFPASRSARALLAQPTWAGGHLIDYVQFHVDFDHDGHSPAFGGGDCDDGDASVFVGATERAGDGRDSDCDGFDDPKPNTFIFEPYHGLQDRNARLIAERAKRFPTVVILVDALRFDRVGDPRFPQLAQLARESLRFSHVYATSATTLTSVPAMMSGHVLPDPGQDDIVRAIGRVGQASRFVAPDVLGPHFGTLASRNPMLGFSATDMIPTNYARTWPGGESVSTSDQITASALRDLDSVRPSDLLWLHYYDLHQWSALDSAVPPFRGDAARYDAVLERLDRSLRPLLDRRDRVTFVLLADHGEGLGARGVEHHTSFLFEELAHIPTLVRVPGIAPATVDVPLSSTCVFNALRSLRGLEPDDAADPSLLSFVGASDVGGGPGFVAFENAQWSFLYGTRRLLYLPRRQIVELYDLQHDPTEQDNRADAEPVLASQLLQRLFRLRNESSL